ncbi:MAG: hypothetical protein Kow0068_01970 [Marinilabiliales bacterium]
MKIFAVIYSLCLISFSFYYSFGQTNNDSITTINDNLVKNKKQFYTIETGGYYFKSQYFGANAGTYVKPVIHYRLSDRLNIQTGLMLINNNLSVSPFSDKNYQGNFTSSYFAIGAEYSLNPKINLHSMIYKEINSKLLHPFSVYSFGADYKIGENSYIGIEVQLQNGNNPFMYRNNFNTNNFPNTIFY